MPKRPIKPDSESFRRAAERARELADVATQGAERVTALGDQQEFARATGFGQSSLEILAGRLRGMALELESTPEPTRLERLAIDLARGIRRFTRENGENYRTTVLDIYVDAEPRIGGKRRTVQDAIDEIAALWSDR